ncbi:MAG: hypothetical protein IPN33_14420 [Saprospiraceae bacterium]|nr:hypothetical protein [Saprospiraceae bacterium]
MQIDITKILSEDRIKYAEDLLKKKQSRNEEIDLYACIQLSDIGTIVKKSDDLKNSIIKWTEENQEADSLKSNNDIEKIFKKANKLRDYIAHSQLIDGKFKWEDILGVATFLDAVLDGLDKNILH